VSGAYFSARKPEEGRGGGKKVGKTGGGEKKEENGRGPQR